MKQQAFEFQIHVSLYVIVFEVRLVMAQMRVGSFLMAFMSQVGTTDDLSIVRPWRFSKFFNFVTISKST